MAVLAILYGLIGQWIINALRNRLCSFRDVALRGISGVDGLERLRIVPGEPLAGGARDGGGVLLEGRQVVKGIDVVELARVKKRSTRFGITSSTLREIRIRQPRVSCLKSKTDETQAEHLSSGWRGTAAPRLVFGVAGRARTFPVFG